MAMNYKRQATQAEMEAVSEVMKHKAIVHRYGVKRSIGMSFDEILAIAEVLNGKEDE